MRDLLGGSDHEEGFGQDTRIRGRLVAHVGQLWVRFHPLSHRLVRGDPAKHPLTSGIVSAVEALEQGLEVRMAVDRNAEHLALHAAVEAFHHAIGFRRVGPCGPVLRFQLAAENLEAVCCKAGASIREDVRDLEGEGLHGFLEEGHSARGRLVLLHGQVHPARAAVDGNKEVALTGDAIPIPQLGQVLHVHVHEAEPVLLEGSIGLARAAMGGKAVEALSFEDAVDGIPVQVGQEVGDHKGEIIQRKASRAAQGADDGALFLTGFPGQLVRPSRAVLAGVRSALAPLADGFRRDAIALG